MIDWHAANQINASDYKNLVQVNNIPCDDMPLILPSHALYWCVFYQKARTFDHRFVCGPVCGAASKVHTLPPSCLNCKQTLHEPANDLNHYRCATCGARYCN